MKARSIAIIPFLGFLIVALVVNPKRLGAQAGPGPLAGPQSQDRSPAQPPPLSVRPKQPQAQVPPRTTLAGPWKFNHDESDDPLQKVRSAESQSSPDPDRYPGGGYPGGAYPGGNPGGYPGRYPGGGYPREVILEAIPVVGAMCPETPARTLQITPKCSR
jgi:hypothetical protein